MKKLLFLLTMSFPLLLYGQQAVLSGGGEATGIGGTSSCSVGQVAYTYKGSSPSVSEGVQQAFEVTNLPIELLYFDAEVSKRSEVELSWETVTELNNDYFTIERSQNTRDWEYVAKVSGSGTTTERQSYSYVDGSPYKGLSYYRLKQTDFDGSFSYSEIRSVYISHGMISFYPNPFKDNILIETEDYPLEYQISDISGKLLKTGLILDIKTELDLSDLVSGVYTLRFQSEQASLLTQKLIKL
jgi:hypothetical protein